MIFETIKLWIPKIQKNFFILYNYVGTLPLSSALDGIVPGWGLSFVISRRCTIDVVLQHIPDCSWDVRRARNEQHRIVLVLLNSINFASDKLTRWNPASLCQHSPLSIGEGKIICKCYCIKASWLVGLIESGCLCNNKEIYCPRLSRFTSHIRSNMEAP